MATYTFYPTISGTIIEVDLPYTEVTIQELVTTIRDWEDNLANMEWPKIIDAAGKEELGGGVLVGITTTLRDTKLKFADRPGPDWVVCNIGGGNLVATSGTVDNYVNPIEPSSYVTVTKTSSSSATLQELEAIQFSSFNEGVIIDVDNISNLAQSGTTFPAGTAQQPCLFVSEAIEIAVERGLGKLYIYGNIILNSGDYVDGYVIQGQSHNRSKITIKENASTSGCEYRYATVTGTLDGDSIINDCTITDLSYVEGQIRNCVLKGHIWLSGNSPTNILNCWDGTPNDQQPTIDCGGAGRDLTISQYAGEIVIDNLTGNNSVAIDLVAGEVWLTSGVTSGVIDVRGVGHLNDGTTGNAIVDADGVLCINHISNAVWEHPTAAHSGAGTFGNLMQDTKKKVLGLY